MSLFQCRRFQFFDLEKVDVDITVKENLKGRQVVCGASGRGLILLGDSDGILHSISRQLESRRVTEAHPGGIIQIHQLKQSPYVLTLGLDDPGVYSIKIWDQLSFEPDSSKTQFYLKRTLKLNRQNKVPTCFTAHENLNLLAIGYTDGFLQIYRGEFRKEKNMKPKSLLMEDDNGGITGLAFKTITTTTEKSTSITTITLFVSSKHCIYTFDVTPKDREIKLQTDKAGCALNCSCYSDGSSEDNYIVGRNDAVYCYTREARGPCYGFDGEKQFLHSFRGHLLIISKLSSESYNMIVFDCSNKYVGFSSSLVTAQPIRVVVGEWGCFFLITSDGTLWQLKEKDLQTKMSVFYKKNHYDLAIKVAKSNNFDGDSIADVFRRYGDHLYAKGDLDGAIRQYCKTVGKLEASYVVRKYIDASRVLNLLEYLEVVHKTPYVTPNLTTLLLNCLTKLKLNEKIERYVGDPSCDFLEPEMAIKVFRRGGMYKHAYQLAQKHQLYGSALQILLEDVRDPSKEDLYTTLESAIKGDNAETVLKRCGHLIVSLLCQSNSSEGSKNIIRLLCECSAKREIVDLFVANKEILTPLLENICLEFEPHDGPLMNLLLETYLEQWAAQEVAANEKLMALLSKAPECPSWDWARALFACKKYQFSQGEIIAYEKLGLHSDLLGIRFTAAQSSISLWPDFIETCRKYAKNKPGLWKDAFYLITSSTNTEIPKFIVEEILDKILEEGLLEPLPILDKLCQTNLKLGSVRNFLSRVLDRTEIENDEAEGKKLQENTKTIKLHAENIRTKPSVFQGSRCNACMQKLEFPSVHFLCLHSFHQHCFESYAENEKDCPICVNKHKDLIGAELKNKPSRAVMDADFTLKLSTAKSNSFAVVADFFAKGIFTGDKEGEVELQKKALEKVRGPAKLHSVTENVSEGRLRINEGSKRDRIVERFGESSSQAGKMDSLLDAMKESTKSVPIVPLTMDTKQYISSSSGRRIGIPSLSLQVQTVQPQNLTPVSTDSRKKERKEFNPFEEDDEDDSNNPFLDKCDEPGENEVEHKDYDPSLNPFES